MSHLERERSEPSIPESGGVEEYLPVLLNRRSFLFTLGGLVGGGAGAAVVESLKPPVWKVDARVKIEPGGVAAPAVQPLTYATVPDYIAIFNGAEHKLRVAKNLGFSIDEETATAKTANSLPFNVKASGISKSLGTSQLVDISVESASPKLSFEAAGETIRAMQSFIEQRYQERMAAIREEQRAQLPLPDQIYVIEPPRMPEGPIDKKAQIAGVGVVAGAFIGVGAVVALEYLFRRIRTPMQAARILELPVLAEVYKLNKSNHGQMWSIQEGNGHSFRALRSRLRYALDNTQNGDHQMKVIAVSSSREDEGKSTVALGLADSLANENEKRKVLVIDCDPINPTVNTLTGLDNTPGLSDWILGDSLKQDQVIRPVPGHKFRVITAGPRPEDTGALLESETFAQRLAALRDQFDTIILDSPPYKEGAEVEVSSIAEKSDGMIFVVDVKSTLATPAVKAVGEIRARGTTLLGLVVNNVPFPKSSYYGYGGRK